MKLIHQFLFLNLIAGLSAELYTQGQHHTALKYDPKACTFTNEQGGEYQLRLKPDKLYDAAYEYAITEEGMRDMDRLGLVPPERATDPLRCCPACARTLNQQVPGVPLAVCADACCKYCRHKSAGTSSEDMMPSTDSHMGPLADAVRTDYETGKLQSAAKQRQQAEEQAAAASEAPANAQPACTTQLHCNRTTAGANDKLSMHGIVGIVCTHIIPALGLFVPMPTYEQHYYYDVLFLALLAARPDVDIIYLDLACRYSARFTRLLAEQVAKGNLLQAVAQRVKVKLPWMHGFDHDHACQLQFSGLYTDGAGGRVGEQSEQFFSKIKRYAKLAKYMAEARWRDGLNLLLLLQTRISQINFADLLGKKIKRTANKLDSSQRALEGLRKEAAAHGINDLDMALRELEAAESPQGQQLSNKGQYVMSRIMLESIEEVRQRKAAFTLLLPGSTGIQVHAKGNDTKLQLRLERDVEYRALKCGIIDGTPWPEDSADFQEGLAEVRHAMVLQYRRAIEEQVFKRKLLEQSLEQEESGKNMNKLKKRSSGIRSNIADLLGVLFTWMVYATAAAPTAVTDGVVNLVCNGDFPWKTGTGEEHATNPNNNSGSNRNGNNRVGMGGSTGGRGGSGSSSSNAGIIGGSINDGGSGASGSSGAGGRRRGGNANSSTAARTHFARRYRTALCHVARTQEEQRYLVAEVARANNWVKEQSALAKSKLEAVPQLSGRAMLLQRELLLLEGLGLQLAQLLQCPTAAT